MDIELLRLEALRLSLHPHQTTDEHIDKATALFHFMQGPQKVSITKKDGTVVTYPPHLQRVIQEKAELDTKLINLSDFIQDSPIYQSLSEDEKSDLTAQRGAMEEYSVLLGSRLTRAGVE